ncbi:hypothetical protein HDU67_009663 [Dinochytrium kinnereticum]|nr:hypothetical protein HDU67_009663 [Dinochytrium kinnereticum]
MSQDIALYLRSVMEIWRTNRKARIKIVLMSLLPLLAAGGWIMILTMLINSRRSNSIRLTRKINLKSVFSSLDSPDPNGYILWTAPSGPHDQILGLHAALLIGAALNRTVVLPPMILGIPGGKCWDQESVRFRQNFAASLMLRKVDGEGLTGLSEVDKGLTKDSQRLEAALVGWDKVVDLAGMRNGTGVKVISDVGFAGLVDADFGLEDPFERLKGSGLWTKLSDKQVFYVPSDNSSQEAKTGMGHSDGVVELTHYEAVTPSTRNLHLGCLSETTQVIFTDHRKYLACSLRRSFKVFNPTFHSVALQLALKLGGVKSYWSVHLNEEDLTSDDQIQKAVEWTVSHIVSNSNGFNQTSHARKTLNHKDRLTWCKEGSTASDNGPNTEGYDKGPIIFLSTAIPIKVVPKSLIDAFPCLFTLSELDHGATSPLFTTDMKPKSKDDAAAVDHIELDPITSGLEAVMLPKTGHLLTPIVELLVASLSAKVIGKPHDGFVKLARSLASDVKC